MGGIGDWLCRIGIHDENRSQGPVGYCGRGCGDLKRWHSSAHGWTRYVQPPAPGSIPKLPQSIFNMENDRDR